jgi:hypothetical protein
MIGDAMEMTYNDTETRIRNDASETDRIMDKIRCMEAENDSYLSENHFLESRLQDADMREPSRRADVRNRILRNRALIDANARQISELTASLELSCYLEASMDEPEDRKEKLLLRRDLVVSSQGAFWKITDGKISNIDEIV